MIDRLIAWWHSRESNRLCAEIDCLKGNHTIEIGSLRIADLESLRQANQAARSEAVRHALSFENADVNAWLQEIASTDKGALAVELREARQTIKALEKRLDRAAKDRDVAERTCDGVLRAYERAAGLTAHATWDKDKNEWKFEARDPILPPEVLDALRAWINREVKPSGSTAQPPIKL